jgi:hypothetical protein
MENDLHALAQILARLRRGCIGIFDHWNSGDRIARVNYVMARIPGPRSLTRPGLHDYLMAMPGALIGPPYMLPLVHERPVRVSLVT